MGFDSPITILPTSLTPANQVFSGTMNSKALPFTTPTKCRVRRVALNNGTGATSLLQAGFTPAIATAGFAYAVDVTANAVKVINQVTGAVAASVATPLLSSGVQNQLAITPDKKFVYVPAGGADAVYVINTATNAVVATIALAVGAGPVAVSITPDGVSAYVSNYSNGTISVITIATNAVATSFAATLHPNSSAITPDGSIFYYADGSTNLVYAITIANNTVAATVAAMTSNSAAPSLAMNPAGTALYVSDYNANTVTVISTATNLVTATIVGFNLPSSIAMSPDGTALYVGNNGAATATVSVISTATNAIIRTIILTGAGQGLFGLAVTPDGKTLFAADMHTYVYSINIAAGTVTVVTGLGADAIHNIATTPSASAMSLASAMVINANSVAGATAENTIPFDLPAGAGLGILSSAPGIVFWSVEIENLS